MVKKINIEITFNKKLFYTFITIIILSLVGVGVLAGTNKKTEDKISLWTNPKTGIGHSLTELEPCNEGEILKMNQENWTCAELEDFPDPIDLKLEVVKGFGKHISIATCPSEKYLISCLGGYPDKISNSIRSIRAANNRECECIGEDIYGNVRCYAMCGNVKPAIGTFW